MSHDHFKGKKAAEHIKEARAHASKQTEAMHGLETPGHIIAGADSSKEIALLCTLLYLMIQTPLLMPFSPIMMIGIIVTGWVIWKVCRSALHGWARLSRLHRLIAEEKKEIEVNRKQEKEELTEMYRAKGFEGKLLEDVIDVLMADDNRLLQVMLEEEMGLQLESFEHPLKQASGALIASIITAIVSLLSAYCFGLAGLLTTTFIFTALSGFISAKTEKNPIISTIVWHVSSVFLAIITTYFITQAIS